MGKIVLRLEGGLIEVISAPPGVEVEVHDYDCDNVDEERTTQDAEGYTYLPYELDTPASQEESRLLAGGSMVVPE